ncbi:hypothetical protein VNO77_40010 [Canavalia gladiata]|uniref:Peptidase metallopeptidase domain-containing protein n=1 Tax=Canavalia gladiata TaxID=3824 RepID=A0AAN9K0Z1_CANGL
MTLSNHRGVLYFALIILHFLTTLFPSVSAHMFHHGTLGALHNNNLATYSHGQNYEDLSIIKKYFHHLGYIPNAPHSNFNNNFDQTLVSAIKAYQKNYKLNVTGEFDKHTLQHLRVPRCGVPDIINGTTGSVQVANYSFFPGRPRWPQVPGRLTYGFDQGGIQIPTNFRNAIINGMNRWSQVSRTSFQSTTTNPQLRFGFYRGNHGDGSPFDGPLGTLAHAFAPTNGRCHFDADERWVPDVTQSPGQNNFDLESVATHEVGHLLGLHHSNDPNAIMFPSIPSGTRKVNLGQDDIEGIRVLYNIN